MEKARKIGLIIVKIIVGIFTILGFIQTFDYFYNRQYRQESEITIYDYDSQKLIRSNSSNKIKIYYQDNLVENLYYKSFTIKNTGIRPMNPNDYIENICIETSNNIILDSQIISSSNSYIKENITEKSIIEKNKICFPNILLNSDDYFQIDIITKDVPKNNNITGVVLGINKLLYC